MFVVQHCQTILRKLLKDDRGSFHSHAKSTNYASTGEEVKFRCIKVSVLAWLSIIYMLCHL